ncbi:MAG TPA: hypothetical protein VFU14_15700 [Acidimicrobiales bacterium]|nr:hypothetical protein [Acidimicrobiales bacterium]
MTTDTRRLPVVLDAAALAAIQEEPLGELAGVCHRPVWTDGVSKAGVMRVDAGHRLGAHTHRRHHHHMWVVEGRAEILGSKVGPGSYVHVPDGVEHDVDATATDGCTFFYLYVLGAGTGEG